MKADLVVAVLESALHGDRELLKERARQLAADEQNAGHSLVAGKILRTLRRLQDVPETDAPQTTIGPKFATPRIPPSSIPDGESHPWTFSTSKATWADVILSKNNQKQLDQLALELRDPTELRAWGIHTNPRVLLKGPSGTGKTLALQALANQSNRPLLTVHLESILSSYLGETSRNLQEAFHAAQSHDAILFLDEIDAVSRSRDDRQEMGEMRRTVNALIMLLDRYHGTVPVFAATNHVTDMDSAILRRFPETMTFDAPDNPARHAMFELKLRRIPFKKDEISIEGLAKLTKGLVGSDIDTIIHKAVRSAMHDQRRALHIQDVVEAISITRQNKGLPAFSFVVEDGPKWIAYMLRASGRTQTQIAETGIGSQSAVSIWLKKIEEQLDQDGVEYGDERTPGALQD